MTLWKLLVLAVALSSLAVWQPAQAGTASSDPTLVVAGKGAASDDDIPAMPASAKQGLWCLAGATASLGAAYAIGPSEIVMMVSGAMHIPSSGPLLFIPLFSLLAGGSCALASAAQPAIAYAGEQSGNIAQKIGDEFSALSGGLVGTKANQFADGGADDANKGGTSVRPMQDSEIMSTGCVTGALSGFLASMASSPMEVVMLSAGGITVASSTPILAVGLLGTIMASGCAIGNYALLPIVTLFSSLSGGGSHSQALNGTDTNSADVGHKLAAAANVLSGSVTQSLEALGRSGVALQVADGNAVAH